MKCGSRIYRTATVTCGSGGEGGGGTYEEMVCGAGRLSLFHAW